MAKAEYCSECRRIKGVGCACGMTLTEKLKGSSVNLGTFKAVPKDERRKQK